MDNTFPKHCSGCRCKLDDYAWFCSVKEGIWCDACFARTSCGQGLHGEQCPNQILRGDSNVTSEAPPRRFFQLSFDQLARVNATRCHRWHKNGVSGWSPVDWSNAMAGEAGEVCNAVKKLRRIEGGQANISDPDRQLSTRTEAIAKIGEEIADVAIYLDLLAQSLGLDMGSEVVIKFNRTSERYGFPERLADETVEFDDAVTVAAKAMQESVAWPAVFVAGTARVLAEAACRAIQKAVLTRKGMA